MRMLILVSHFLLAPWSSLTLANSSCNTMSSNTFDILTCINASKLKIDKKLNDQYQTLMSNSEFSEKKLLAAVERAWINYRNSYCEEAFESVYPGKESEIERENCIASLTSDRLIELIYIETGVPNDNYYDSINAIADISLKQREDVFKYLKSKHLSNEGLIYLEKNCKLTQIVNQESVEHCNARMRFKIQ